MFVVKKKLQVLTEILTQFLPVLPNNPSKKEFGRIRFNDWKDNGNSDHIVRNTKPKPCQ